MQPITVFQGNAGSASLDDIKADRRPCVLRGFASTWPSVRAAMVSDEVFCEHLLRFDRGHLLNAIIAPPEAEGRPFYNPSLTGLNFNHQKVGLRLFLEHLLHLRQVSSPHTLFVQSTLADESFPGFCESNPNAMLPNTAGRIWIGNRTRVATHFDTADNMAIVLAGHRRFTLFPPEEVANLYVGPLDFTPAGQPVSLADPLFPDFERFPRFENAMRSALVCDLAPGDALYIPSPWWHHVEALSGFNTLINYWWRDYPSDCGNPFNWLVHGLLSVRHLPLREREAWRAFANHYIFEDDGDPAAHLPLHARSALQMMDEDLAQRLRLWLASALSS